MGVFYHIVQAAKGKKNRVQKHGHKGQQQSRHVVSLLPSIELAEAAGALLLYILELSSFRSALLVLSLPGCQLSPASNSLFFHPNFLPTWQNAMSFFIFILSPKCLCWHSRWSRRPHPWFATSLIILKLLSFPHRQQRRERGLAGVCRQIKAETDRYGNSSVGHVCLCVFTADSLQEAYASVCLLKTENTLHLLWRLWENAFQCVCSGLLYSRVWDAGLAHCCRVIVALIISEVTIA